MKKASQSKMYSMRLEIALINALQKIKKRDGIPVTEQVKRAIRAWLEKKGVKRRTFPARTRSRMSRINKRVGQFTRI